MTRFTHDLDKQAANFQPLTPLDFLARAADILPDKPAVVHGDRHYSYREFYRRCRRLAGALTGRGIGRGDTVSVMAPNVPALLEAHFGVPMIGAVLNAINTRLDAATIAFILEHGGAKVLLTDREYSPVVKDAVARLETPPLVIDIDDKLTVGGERIGATDYENFLGEGDPDFAWQRPADEWDALSLCYTSGTTGDPKGVVYHHRGAYLNAVGNAMMFGLGADTVYLWTLPMFHCNGWSFPWAVTAVAGTHVCLRDIEPGLVYATIEDRGVTHFCAAPVILNLLIHAPDKVKRSFGHPVHVATGGAAPPSAVIGSLERQGFHITHLYGLTESYGPSMLCVWQEEWNALDADARAAKLARQGVRYVTLSDQMVADPDTMAPVPEDGTTIGELMLRGNTVMKGYLNNRAATQKAFAGDWFHTGDLGVVHPDGYVEIKDRSKDIIISGGENISSLEIEEALYKHPEIMEAAVVAKPDEKWGETPCAFVTLRPGAGEVSDREVIAWCRDHLAHFKCPQHVVFGPLPKTATGKIQKFVLRERAMKA